MLYRPKGETFMSLYLPLMSGIVAKGKLSLLSLDAASIPNLKYTRSKLINKPK